MFIKRITSVKSNLILRTNHACMSALLHTYILHIIFGEKIKIRQSTLARNQGLKNGRLMYERPQ